MQSTGRPDNDDPRRVDRGLDTRPTSRQGAGHSPGRLSIFGIVYAARQVGRDGLSSPHPRAACIALISGRVVWPTVG